MSETVSLFTTVVILIACIIAVVFVGWGSMDLTVVQACEANGYWQTGQTRVICHVEKKGE